MVTAKRCLEYLAVQTGNRLERLGLALGFFWLFLITQFHDLIENEWRWAAWALLSFSAALLLRIFRLPFCLLVLWLGWEIVDIAYVGPGLSTTMQVVLSSEMLKYSTFIALSIAAATQIKSPSHWIRFFLPVACIASFFGQRLVFNESMNAALLVACLPLAPWWNLFLVIPVVLLQQGSTAYVMLAVQIMLQMSGHRYAGAVIPPIILVVILKLAWIPGALTDPVRFEYYRAAWNYFVQKINILTGSGLGSFTVYGQIVQKATTDRHALWLQLHSDWGQLLFETGLVGFVLGVWVYADSVARASRPVRHALLLLGLCGIFYFPTRIPITLFYCVWLITLTQLKRKTSNGLDQYLPPHDDDNLGQMQEAQSLQWQLGRPDEHRLGADSDARFSFGAAECGGPDNARDRW